MKQLTNNVNYKWSLLYPSYLRAKGKRKELILHKLFSLLQENAFINLYNYNGRNDKKNYKRDRRPTKHI